MCRANGVHNLIYSWYYAIHSIVDPKMSHQAILKENVGIIKQLLRNSTLHTIESKNDIKQVYNWARILGYEEKHLSISYVLRIW